MAHDALVGTPLKENEAPHDVYTSALAENLYGSTPQSPLPISAAPRTPMSPSEQRRREMTEAFQQQQPKIIKTKGSSEPTERTLDAPNLIDDYYLNLVDWSCKNVLAVALNDSVYLWREDNVQRLCSLDDENFVTSLSWSFDGSCLAVGTHGAEVQLWDVQRMSLVRNFSGHTLRVGSLAWNGHMLSSGSRDTYIINHDVRLGAHRVGALNAHTQEVCGLRWSRDGSTLASGGNDNLLNIWDVRHTTAPRFSLTEHVAAVKALAWSPFQSTLLASGGGTADRTIRFWNTMTGTCINTIDTQSQVCALLWGRNRELVSAHGFSQNQICVWQYPQMTKTVELRGHTSRVLHLALSPDGTTIVSAAGDETLRFWRALRGSPSPSRISDSALRVSIR